MPDIGNENFRILNRHLGWGDPNEGIWCIGIEEGVGYKNPEDIKRYTENGKEFISVSAGQVQEHAQKRRSPYIEYPSKIAAGLTNGPHHNKWKEYRDNVLWQTGSKVCHANIYPLGKPRATEQGLFLRVYNLFIERVILSFVKTTFNNFPRNHLLSRCAQHFQGFSGFVSGYTLEIVNTDGLSREFMNRPWRQSGFARKILNYSACVG